MVPAQQRLAGDDPARAQVDARLKIHIEFMAIDRIPEVRFGIATTADTRLHVLFEETDDAAPRAFRLVKRHVRMTQQLVDVRPVMRETRDADTGANDNLFTCNVVGLAHLLDEATRQSLRGLPPANAALEHDELVAPQPRGDVATPDHRPQPLGCKTQQLVPRRMP